MDAWIDELMYRPNGRSIDASIDASKARFIDRCMTRTIKQPTFFSYICFVINFTCTQEYVKCCTNLRSNLDNLKTIDYEQRSILQQERRMIITECLKGQVKKFKVLPLQNEFVGQFKHIKPRYKFYVADGESGIGKTQWAKYLFDGDPSKVLEINCANCPEPDLRSYTDQAAILFDEATPEMVIAQKKLFQSPAVDVELGMSTTNCHSYSVFVSGVAMIVASNTWKEKVAAMPSARDRAWLEDNSFLVEMGRTKCWVDE